MNINIKATNMELTVPVSGYINNSLSKIKKFIGNKDEIIIFVEVAKTTNHHKQGDVFKAEFNLEVSGTKFYVLSEKEDLYKAIDQAKHDMIRQIKGSKERKKTLFKRGSISVKKMIKGISRRNPFTSKY